MYSFHGNFIPMTVMSINIFFCATEVSGIFIANDVEVKLVNCIGDDVVPKSMH